MQEEPITYTLHQGPVLQVTALWVNPVQSREISSSTYLSSAYAHSYCMIYWWAETFSSWLSLADKLGFEMHLLLYTIQKKY